MVDTSNNSKGSEYTVVSVKNCEGMKPGGHFDRATARLLMENDRVDFIEVEYQHVMHKRYCF